MWIVFDYYGNFLGKFSTYKEAVNWVYPQGGYGIWTIKYY